MHSDHSGIDIIANIMADSGLQVISSLLMQTISYYCHQDYYYYYHHYIIKKSVFSCIEDGIKLWAQVCNF